MIKITLSINNLFKLLLFSSLLCDGLSAQECPANITVPSDEGQCGAAVTYLVAGGGATQSVNGVVNPNGTNGLTGWTNSTDFGGAWAVSGSGFISSYNSGSMSQVIDLTTMGMTDAYMDTLPAITVSEQYMGGTPNVGDTYKLTVQLRGEADNILATYTTGNVTCTAAWQTASHVFTGYPAGVRKIFFQHTGDDAEYWAGNYGAMTTNSTVTVAVPTSTAVQTAGIASGEVFPIGTTTNTFTITSEDDVVTTCTFNVTVIDSQAPVAIAQNLTAMLDANGVATVSAAAVNNGSTDNCTNLTYALDVTQFNCEDLGENTVTLSVSDGTNTTTATAIVTVVDETAPVIVFEDATIEVGNDGSVTILTDEIMEASTDNCSVATYTISPASLSCADLGPNEVTVTATDASGNSTTRTATITVTDATAPTVITQNITLSLPEVTLLSINELDIDNGSFDNCGISSYSLDTQVFTCENIGVNTVTLTITDNNGNTSTGTATVIIEDPNAYCPQTVGVEGFNLNNSLIIYPNPTNGTITFNAGSLTVDKIEIFDISARLVKSFNVAAQGIFVIDLSSFNTGIYFAKIYAGSEFAVKRIIKE